MAIYSPILSMVEKAVQDGMKAGAKDVLKRARALSPTDTGDSDRSGFVAVDDMTVQVGFTSLVSKLQHEQLDWNHAGGGQAKFLEAAFDEVDFEGIVAKSVKAALGG